MSRLLRILLVVLAATASLEARAASLRLRDGSFVTVKPVAPVASAASMAAVRLPLEYTFIEADGRRWTGEIPDSAGVRLLDVTLAQSPVSGELMAVFARPLGSKTQLVASRWLGQGFSDPGLISAEANDDHRPILAYDPSGDALLTWQRGVADGRLLLRHFDLNPGGTSATYTFIDAGRPSDLLPHRWGAGFGGFAHVVGVVPAPDALAAYVLVSRADASDAAVLYVALDSVEDPGGFGAAPVPVTFISPAANSSGSSYVAPRTDSAPGVVLAPWRMTMGAGSAWYWAVDGTVSLVTFKHEVMGRLVTFAEPADPTLLHVEAYRLAVAELGMAAPRRPGAGPTLAPGRRDR